MTRDTRLSTDGCATLLRSVQAMGGLQLRFEGGKVLRGDKDIRKIGLLAGGVWAAGLGAG
jgi:hypothetical protein